MMRYLWSEPACPAQGLRGAREPGRGAGWLGGCFVIISLGGAGRGGDAPAPRYSNAMLEGQGEAWT